MQSISSNESGRSLIEMLGTIAIITMITIGGIAATRTGMDMFRANNSADQIEQIAQGIADLYSWRKNYNGVGSDAFWRKNCAGVYKPCTNGKFEPIVGTDMTVSQQMDGFSISITGIPAVTCRALKEKEFSFISVSGSCPESRFGTGNLTFYAE